MDGGDGESTVAVGAAAGSAGAARAAAEVDGAVGAAAAVEAWDKANLETITFDSAVSK